MGGDARMQIDSQVIANVTSLGSGASLWPSQRTTGLDNDGYGDP